MVIERPKMRNAEGIFPSLPESLDRLRQRIVIKQSEAALKWPQYL